MTTNILSKVLGNNAFYTDTYIRDTITFVKSILVKNHEEAKLGNTLLALTHPTHLPDRDPTEWRYYKHLQGLPYVLDTPITLTSIDSGEPITLSRQALLVHRKTRQELLKFGLLFDTLVKLHPHQQLFIKAVTLTPIHTDEDTILALPDYTIVAYNHNFIEENEHDLIPELQQRIINYKPIWLIPYYANLDNLFLASQYTIFYQFLFTSLLAIRLSNAKTMKAHSFHIRLYLASHYRLDEQMLFLSRRQQLYLYRNLRYLNNHAGKNHVFRTLINELFNEHNVSVVNYVHNQNNTLDQDNYVNYTYNQKLLNAKNLVYTDIDYGLDYLSAKEKPLAPGNVKTYEYNYQAIDRKNKRSLMSTLLTKDLETILIDETDTVQYKLVDTVTDYWAYLVKHNHISFLTEVTDPVTNISVRLNPRDLFKLYAVVLFASQGVQLDSFPTYPIKRVFKENLPTADQLLGAFYTRRTEYTGYLQEVIDAVPAYGRLLTNFEFGEFVTDMYKVNVGMWHLLSNHSDIDTEGQMRLAIDRLNVSEHFEYGDESVSEMLTRIGVKDPRAYETEMLGDYAFSIIDEIFDKKLSYIRRLKKLQQALAQVFFNFNSYTVQLINNYYNDSPILTGLKDRRYGSTYKVKLNLGNGGGGTTPDNDGVPEFLRGSQNTLMPSKILNSEPVARYKSKLTAGFNVNGEYHYKLKSEADFIALVDLDVRPSTLNLTEVGMPKTGVFETDQVSVKKTFATIYFHNDILYTGTRIAAYSEVGFNVTVNSKVRYVTPAKASTELNTDIQADTFTTASLSEDDALIFLALNT